MGLIGQPGSGLMSGGLVPRLLWNLPPLSGRPRTMRTDFRVGTGLDDIAHWSDGRGECFGDRVLCYERLASVPGGRKRLVPETIPCGGYRMVIIPTVIWKLLDPERVVERSCGTEQADC